MKKNKIVKAMPTVLFITGIVGIFVSEVMAARDTLKAEKIVIREVDIVEFEETPEEEKSNDDFKFIKLSTKKRPFKEYAPEVIKATWKCYIPTFVTTTLTLSALIASKRLTAKQLAVMSSAIAGAGSLVSKYRNEIRKISGEEVLEKVDKAVAESVPTREPKAYKGETINDELGDDDGEIWVTDQFTGMRFLTTKLALRSAEYFYNMEFHCSPFGSISLERFYNLLGLTLPDEYKYCEWDIENFQDSYGIWIGFDHVPDDNGGYILIYDIDPEGGPDR